MSFGTRATAAVGQRASSARPALRAGAARATAVHNGHEGGGRTRGIVLLRGGSGSARRRGSSRARLGLFARMVDRIDQRLETGAILAHLPDGTRRRSAAVHRASRPRSISATGARCCAWPPGARSAGTRHGRPASGRARPGPAVRAVQRQRRSLGDTGRAKGPGRWSRRRALPAQQSPPAGGRNIHAHYDLGNDFYAAWLDATMSYSTRLRGDEGLEAAQTRKMDALLERLGVARRSLARHRMWMGGAGDHCATRGGE